MRPIDADALLGILCQWQEDAEKSRPDDVGLMTFNHGVMALAQAAAAQVPALTLDDLRPTGEWIEYEPTIALAGCSICDYKIHHVLPNRRPRYCPNCGARMEGK